jgi:hypothetical protein
MLNVLFPRKRWGSPRVWQGVACCLGIALVLPLPAQAQTKSSDSKSAPKSGAADAANDDEAKAKPEDPAPQSKADAAKGAAAEPVREIPADPSLTRKISPNEVFRDPKAEALLNVLKFPELNKNKAVPNEDVLKVKEMAANPNVNLDTGLMERVIDAQIAKLTDHANIEAILSTEKAAPAAVRAIHDATNVLLEPLFLAKALVPKNDPFLTAYSRLLVAKLKPLLNKTHLIPRIQMMIVLGQSGHLNALPTFQEQIKDKNQTIWVKLWAMEGISNIRADGRQMSGTAQIDSAKVVSDLLDQDKEAKELPWPVQLRALETLGAMRQGYLPNLPQKASMASAAMRLLADPQSRLEVRAEAARTLGLMPIAGVVDRYNYVLVAHTTAELAAELGSQIASNFPLPPPPPPKTSAAKGAEPAKQPAPKVQSNRPKSEYYTGLLIGPVYQAFDGVPGVRDSGLMHSNAGPSADAIQKLFDVIKPVAATAVALIRAPGLQTVNLQKDLTKRVAELKDFLDKNPVPDRHLVRGGDEFPVADAAGGAAAAPGLAGQR